MWSGISGICRLVKNVKMKPWVSPIGIYTATLYENCLRCNRSHSSEFRSGVARLKSYATLMRHPTRQSYQSISAFCLITFSFLKSLDFSKKLRGPLFIYKKGELGQVRRPMRHHCTETPKPTAREGISVSYKCRISRRSRLGWGKMGSKRGHLGSKTGCLGSKKGCLSHQNLLLGHEMHCVVDIQADESSF